MTGKPLASNYFLRILKRQTLQLNQSSVNITLDKYLNSVNSMIRIHAPLKQKKVSAKAMDYQRYQELNS